MHLPIAHGEGRFTTKDKDVWKALKANDQMAFSYCDESGKVSDDPVVTPNGSMYAVAGLCNPAGNVVALMPHPERTENGKPYFLSLRRWIETRRGGKAERGEKAPVFAPDGASPGRGREERTSEEWSISERVARPVEIFVGTIITNNEERTVEQAAHRIVPGLKLTQLKYLAPVKKSPESILSHLALFNPNKETAVVRREGKFFKWDSDAKALKPLEKSPLQSAVSFLRRDEPDTGAGALGKGSETGICYVCRGVEEKNLLMRDVLEIFANPHASTLERIV